MADFAAIIGTLGVCIQLSKGIVLYSASFKHAFELAQSLATEVAAVDHVLCALRKHLEEEHVRGSNTFDQTSVLFFAVNGCQKRLQEIHDAIQPMVSGSIVQRMWSRTTWPFEKTETTDAVLALHRYAQIFHFALSIDGLASLCRSQSPETLARIQRSLETIERNQATYNNTDIRDILEMVTMVPAMAADLRTITKAVKRCTIDDEMTKLLDAIPKLSYGERHRNLQLTRMKGAGKWVLDMPKFLQWRNTLSGDGTLWCNGAPGAGKTYLASVIIDHLHEFTERSDQAVLYFYFDYKLQSEQTPLRFIQTLLHQLLSTYSQVPFEALELFDSIRKREDLPNWDTLTSVFLNICNHTRDVYIVLDALDECDKVSNRGPIVDFIRDVKKSNARLVVTSRPYPADIDDLLGRCDQILIEASDADIRAYILDRIRRTPQICSIIDAELKDEIVESVASKSQGMFLLPALQVTNILGQTNKSQIKQALQELPTGLGENLLLTLERIKAQHPHSTTRANLALSVLMWLSTVRRPLTVLELQHAIATDPESKHLGEITNADFFVDCCFGLVIIDETSIIRLVHFSVSEFLEERRDELFQAPDGALATSCLTYILLYVRSRDYRRFKPSLVSNTYAETTDKTWPLLDYSIRYWGLHAKRLCLKSDAPTIVDSKVKEFWSVSSAVKYWLQCTREKVDLGHGERGEEWFDAATYVTAETSVIHIAALYGLTALVRDALAQNPSLTTLKDSKGATPLMLAAAGGCLHVVRNLLSYDLTDVNAEDVNGKTALWYAIHQKRYQVVYLLDSTRHLDINAGGAFSLLCRSVSPWKDNREGESLPPFFLARPDLDANQSGIDDEPPWAILAKNWYLEFLQKLVAHSTFDPWKSSQPNRYHDDFYNYLKNTDYDVDFGTMQEMCDVTGIIQLLDNDPRFDFPELYALELLWPFVYYAFVDLEPKDHYRIDWMDLWDKEQTWKCMLVDALESRGVSFETRDSRRMTFLHYLAQSSDPNEDRKGHLERLLRRLPPDPRDNRERTPLHLAANKGHEDVVRQLLHAGADPLAVDDEGMSVLHYATKSNDAGLVTLLIEHGADVNAKTKHKESILHIAADVSHSEEAIIPLLVNLGVSIADVDNFGRTPLHHALFTTLEVFTTLLKHGADANSWSNKRGPLLTDAVLEGDVAFVKLCLANKKIDFNALDSFGMSVLDHLSLQKPSVAEELGFDSSLWANYRPTPPAERRAHILPVLLERLEIMISSNDRIRTSLAFRTGFQLLKLGDDNAARIMYEADIYAYSKSGTPYFPNDNCNVCYKHERVLFKCKICPYKWICQDCRDDSDPTSAELPACANHDLLQVPGDDWKDLPRGIVNRQGQSFGEWLEEIHKRHATMK